MPVSNDDTRIRVVGQFFFVESISLDPTASECIDKMVAFVIGTVHQRQLRGVYAEPPTRCRLKKIATLGNGGRRVV